MFAKLLDLVETRKIDTPLYPYKDHRKAAIVNEALEFVVEEYRFATVDSFGRIIAMPK